MTPEEKAKKYFDRGVKYEEISAITGIQVEDLEKMLEPKPKTPAAQKKTIEAVQKKVVTAKVKPVQTTTQTQGYNVATGSHTKTTEVDSED